MRNWMVDKFNPSARQEKKGFGWGLTKGVILQSPYGYMDEK